MKYGIRTKLILIATTLLVIPSILIGFSSYGTAKNELDQLGSTGLKNNVIMALELIDLMNKEVEKGNLSLEQAQDKVKEKLIGTLQSDGSRSINSQVDMGENGYFFILDKDGKAIGHPTLEGENLFDSQAPDGMYTTRETIKAAEDGGGFVKFDFTVPGEDRIAPKMVYAQSDPYWGWVIVAGTYLMDFNAGANQVLLTLGIVLGIAIILGIIIIILFSGHLSKPIRLLTERVSRMAEGDLTAERLVVKNRDEIGELTSYFNTMTENLKDVVSQVANASVQVAATSEELSASSEQTSKSVELVAGSMQDLAHGADQQVSHAEIANDVVASMSTRIGTIATNMEQVNQSSRSASERAVDGSRVIERTIAHMHTIQSETDSTAQMINALGDKSKEIGNIVSLITDVAEQTNLLSLNAAIEAARAGEHGKGFSVVANEVKKLAEQTGSSASQVDQLIKSIQQDINDSVKAINQGRNLVEEGIQSADEAGISFDHIVKSIDEVSRQVDAVSSMILTISDEAESMVGTIDKTTKIAEESAAHSQNIAAAAEEQTASMEEIAAASDTLAKMAEELQETIRHFKL